MVQGLNIVPTALSSHDAAWLRKSWPLYFVAVSLKILIEIQIHKNRPSYWDNFGLSGGPHGPTLYWLTRCKHGVKYFIVQSRDFCKSSCHKPFLTQLDFYGFSIGHLFIQTVHLLLNIMAAVGFAVWQVQLSEMCHFCTRIHASGYRLYSEYWLS